VNPVKSKSIYKSISIIILLALSIIPTTLLTTPMKAQVGTITLSSSNLHPLKVIEIIVYIPGLTADYITLRLSTEAGPVPLIDRDEKPHSDGMFNATKVATGIYYAYLGGNMTNIKVIPKNPPSAVKDESIVNITEKYPPGTTLKLEVLGYGLTTTISYDVVSTTISLDRTSIPVRRSDQFKVTLTINDQDLNLDPTTAEVYKGSNLTYIYFYLMHVNGTTGETRYPVDRTDEPVATDLYTLSTNAGLDVSKIVIKETGVNSGSFFVVDAPNSH